MEIDRKQLLDALTLARPGLASSDVVEQASMFVFRPKDIVTFNDELCVRVKIKSGIEGAVQAQELYAYLSKSKAEKLTMETTEDELIIKAGKRASVGIRLSSKIYLPVDGINDAESFEPLPKNFTKALSLVSQTAAKNASSMPILAALHFVGDKVESCDNFRITAYTFEEGTDFPEFLLPANMVKEVLKFEPVEYSVVEGWAHFRTAEGVWLSCRTVAAGPKGYPDLSGIVEVEGVTIEFPEGFAEVLDRASVFVDKSATLDEFVTISVKEGRASVVAEGTMGWFRESVKVDSDNPECSFNVNPGFLSGILPLLSNAIVGDNYLRLDGEDFLHVMCLCVEK